MTIDKSASSKRDAAEYALGLVRDGMRLGLGTGTTADFFIDGLARRVIDEGLSLSMVATSHRTRTRAEQAGLKLSDLNDLRTLDLTIDGTDEIDIHFNLIKGGGGALLREKIVAQASKEMIVIADQCKRVESLGKFPLPIEIDRFGAQATSDMIRSCLHQLGFHDCRQEFRRSGDSLVVTDGGHYIIDAELLRIDHPTELAIELNQIPGVVETGLFVGICDLAVLGRGNGEVDVISPNEKATSDV